MPFLATVRQDNRSQNAGVDNYFWMDAWGCVNRVALSALAAVVISPLAVRWLDKRGLRGVLVITIFTFGVCFVGSSALVGRIGASIYFAFLRGRSEISVFLCLKGNYFPLLSRRKGRVSVMLVVPERKVERSRNET